MHMYLFSLLYESRHIRSPSCLCIPPPVIFWMPEPTVMRLGMYVTAPELINGILHKSIPSVCVCTCIPLSLLGNGSVKTLPRQRIHTRELKNWILYAVHVVSKTRSRQLVLPRISCLFWPRAIFIPRPESHRVGPFSILGQSMLCATPTKPAQYYSIISLLGSSVTRNLSPSTGPVGWIPYFSALSQLL
jgi:hypothetical protein